MIGLNDQAGEAEFVVVVQQKPRGPTTSELKNTEGVGARLIQGKESSVELSMLFSFILLISFSVRVVFGCAS